MLTDLRVIPAKNMTSSDWSFVGNLEQCGDCLSDDHLAISEMLDDH